MKQALTMDEICAKEDERDTVEKRGMNFSVTECGKQCPFYDEWRDSHIDKCKYSLEYITEFENLPFPDWCELEVV